MSHSSVKIARIECIHLVREEALGLRGARHEQPQPPVARKFAMLAAASTFPAPNNSSRALLRQAASLLLYQAVLHDAVGQAFLELLQSLGSSEGDRLECLQAYGRWFRCLAACGRSWRDHLIERIVLDDNPFSQQIQHADTITALSPSLVAAARHDLRALQAFYCSNGQSLAERVQVACQLAEPPVFWMTPLQSHFLHDRSDWGDALESLGDCYRRQGIGLFGRYRALRWQQEDLCGIPHPDPIRLDDLVGYPDQQELLVKNTEFLLAGLPALHVLLYGSRGSGKSSLVKALLNEYGARGLRLIEVSKAELQALPAIVEGLRQQAQKFIIFVDDLSFEEDDDAFKSLKVILEGSLTARANNVVVYATSNRRHLVREFFADRPNPSESEEVHAWDTQQEKLSFSDRFGLTLTFTPANQDTYLQIVHHLAARAGIHLDKADLEFRAKQWATRHNGRSGRSARQFVDFLQAELRASKG